MNGFACDRLDSLAMNPSPRQLELIEEVRRLKAAQGLHDRRIDALL